MPGNVPAASGNLDVMPNSLCSAFTQAFEFAVLGNAYPDGSSQRRVLISNGGDREDILPRLRWKLTKRLNAEKMVALRNFYDAHVGVAFKFYDLVGGVGVGNFDESGASEDGRFIVTFASEWRQSMGVGRGEAELELVEHALAAGSGALDFSDEENSGHLVTAGV